MLQVQGQPGLHGETHNQVTEKRVGLGALDLALGENLGEITVWCAVSHPGRDAELQWTEVIG